MGSNGDGANRAWGNATPSRSAGSGSVSQSADRHSTDDETDDLREPSGRRYHAGLELPALPPTSSTLHIATSSRARFLSLFKLSCVAFLTARKSDKLDPARFQLAGKLQLAHLRFIVL
ncbi:hypothetical protein J6590_017331 [Homalodisca vitripennis]|nr:hypothetical protein J6590_017331 [Homalodisca vitripennis]